MTKKSYHLNLPYTLVVSTRETLHLEYTRIANAGKNGLRADEGKTLWDCFNSF